MLIISLCLGFLASSRYYTESLRYELFTRGEYNLTTVRSSLKEKSCYEMLCEDCFMKHVMLCDDCFMKHVMMKRFM